MPQMDFVKYLKIQQIQLFVPFSPNAALMYFFVEDTLDNANKS